MENINSHNEMPVNKSKKASLVVRTILYCLFTVVCVFFSIVAVMLSFSKTPENTLQAFGYKFYCVEENIEEIGLSAGSLVVIRDTNTDEFYTHESLSQNIVFSVKSLGYVVKHDMLWMVLCFTVPVALFFLLNLMSELKKKSDKKAARMPLPYSDKEAPDEPLNLHTEKTAETEQIPADSQAEEVEITL